MKKSHPEGWLFYDNPDGFAPLRSERLFSVLDDDAACFARGRETGDGVSPGGADGGDDLFHLAGALGHLPKFLLGLCQLVAETLVALQFSIQHRCAQATCIYVALPVISGNDAALAILIAASQ